MPTEAGQLPGLEGGGGELVCNRDRASAEEDEEVLEMDSGDGCTEQRVFNSTNLYA